MTLLQFNSNDELRLKLINTGSDAIVYAAEETPLGIDYNSRSYGSTRLDSNQNWLGIILTSVREKLVCIC